MIIELTPDEVEEVRYRIGSGSMREGEYVLMLRGTASSVASVLPPAPRWRCCCPPCRIPILTAKRWWPN